MQALTCDLNILERHKTAEEKESSVETSNRLAEGLLRLARQFEDHINISRECILTSFSLQPTKSCLNKIEDIARKCGNEVLDTGQWKCKLHPPISENDDVCVQCKECGEFMGQMELMSPFNTNTSLSEALTTQCIGLSSELCDDLVVVLCSPRYHLLNWYQKWPYLHRLCVMYLNDPEKTKNFVTELKFLSVDYSLFMIKKEKEDVENVTYDVYDTAYDPSYDLELRTNLIAPAQDEISDIPKQKRKRGRPRKIKEPVIDTPTDKQKSSPEVLKSLRNFRRNFKRKIVDTDSSEMMIVESRSAQNFVTNADFNSFQSNYVHDFGASNFSHMDPVNAVNMTHEISTSHSSENLKEMMIRQDCSYKDLSSLRNSYSDCSFILPSTSKSRPSFNYFDNSDYYEYGEKFGSGCNSVSNSAMPDNTLKNLSTNVESNFAGDNKVNEQNLSTSELSSGKPSKKSIRVRPDLGKMCFHSPDNSVSHNSKNLCLKQFEINPKDCPDTKMSSNEFISNNISNSNFLGKSKGETTEKLPSKIFLKDENGKSTEIHVSKIDTLNTEMKPGSQSKSASSGMNLFRDKSVKAFFTKENGQTIKRFRKENVKEYESICNKENSIFMLKKKPKIDTKASEKISPKFLRKSDSCCFGDDLKVNDRKHKCHVFGEKLSPGRSESNSYKETSRDELYIDYKSKFKLKNLKVILHRLNIKYSPNKKIDMFSKKVQSPDKKESSFLINLVNKVQPKRNDVARPLQDKNLKVNVTKNDLKKDFHYKYENVELNVPKEDINLNSYVILERLKPNEISDPKKVLANVPGLNDTELIRPVPTDTVVQVIQISGNRPNSSVTSTNTQTSTQVSPHIQRIGQPRSDKPETSVENSSPQPTLVKTNSNAKPPTTQHSTLINILSQQIIRPAQTHTGRPRTSSLINIFPQQIVRSSTSTVAATKTTTSAVSTDVQVCYILFIFINK